MKKDSKTLLKDLVGKSLPKWYNKKYCATDGLWNEYFQEAEQSMELQWDEIIWPVIQAFNFGTVLELAPGAGRNTEKLAQVAGAIHAIDLNEYALEQLRSRFEDYSGGCNLYFHKNEGSDLKMIEDSSITFVYCWDAAVHFDKSIIKDYVAEFSRVLEVNGTGFVHHSNLGTAAKTDIRFNPHLRSNMSKALFEEYCNENGLQLIDQIDLPWGEITDCISVFRKDRPLSK
jgi:ubiquinone/menaquinone biosynthesis C-methylase UbiE